MNLKVLNISKNIKIGRRFNNYDNKCDFNSKGVEVNYLAWNDEGLIDVKAVGNSKSDKINNYLQKAGYYSGNLNAFYRNSKLITETELYQDSDVLHLHIMHENYLSLNDWASICSKKPVVWTWHDPYMLSGHCIYSKGCSNFKLGCKSCPHLDYHFPIKFDRAEKNLKEKLEFFTKYDPKIIVASEYMAGLIEDSVYKGKIRYEIVPFGIEDDRETKINFREVYAIEEKSVVIGIRAVHSDYKGCDIAKDALSKYIESHECSDIVLMTFQEINYFKSLSKKIRVIDLGWISDSEIYNAFEAMDLFLMPSRQEAFGMMALESMIVGAKPLVIEGTALPNIIESPMLGNSSSVEGFYEMLRSEIDKVRKKILPRVDYINHVVNNFSKKKYIERMLGIYEKEIQYFNNK